MKHTKETIEKMRAIAYTRDNTKRIESMPKGKEHWNYSENPNVLTLHKRIHRKYGKAKTYDCKCGKKALDWAFIGKGEYTDKREDYIPLCRKCHIALDNHPSKVDRTRHKIVRDSKGRIVTTLVQ